MSRDVRGGSEGIVTSPGGPGDKTPWGERQRHQQVDETTKGEWIAVQKKAFTRWANSHLKQKGCPEIGDLFADTSDGILLLQLLEVIGGDSIYSLCKRKYNTNPKFRIHKLENCNLIFEYLRKKELQLTNIGSTDIVDSNEKLILGLMWTIILRFAIAEDGKQGLLLWLQRSTSGYAGVDVTNFDMSWRDGKAFLALIDKYRPDVLKFSEAASGDAHANVALAFRVARDELGIPALLDVEDVADTAKPDEKAMIAYLSLFFAKFANLARKQALVDSIVKAVALSRKHDGLIGRYRHAAADLKAWIADTTATWKAGDKSGSTEEIKAQLTALQEYRKGEKIARKAALLEMTSLLGQLRTSQRSNNRPIFHPEPGLSDKELWEVDWPALEAEEQAYEQALIEKHARFSVVDFALTKTHNKLAKLEPWLGSRCSYFETSDLGSSVSQVEQRLSGHEAFRGQVDVYAALLSECQRLVASELTEEHALVAPTKDRIAAAAARLDKLKGLAADFRARVEARLALEKELAAAAVRYSGLANEVQFVLDQVEEAIAEPILGNSVEEVMALKDRFAALVSDSFRPLEPKVQEVQAIAAKLAEHGRAASLQEETQTTAPDVLLATHARVSQDIKARGQALEQALAQTEHRVEVRQAFAEAARALNAYVAQATDASNVGGGNNRSSLKAEEVVAKLQQLKEEYSGAGREKLAAAEAASAEQEAAGVVSNGFVTETIFSMRKSFEELGKLLDARLEDHMQAQAALQSQTALSDEQWAEITKVFQALDRDRTGMLSNKEFREGLQGLGVLIDDSEADRTFKTLCKTKPNALTLAEFGTYITSVLKAGSSIEDILAAFKSIANGDKAITEDAIRALFLQDDLADFMVQHMPSLGKVKRKAAAEASSGGKGEDGAATAAAAAAGAGEVDVEAFDYTSFVSHIFER